MTGPLMKQKALPGLNIKDEAQSFGLTDYVHYTFPNDLYDPFDDIGIYTHYGQFIDYNTLSSAMSLVQCIDPAAIIRSTVQQQQPPPLSPLDSPSPPEATGLQVTRTIKKRTPTSYDKDTTSYLKSVFFDVYSKQKKLTKLQRREVQNATGIPPRKITYWFSNHKRRFKNALQIYKDAVKNSGGKITCYHEFVLWRRSQSLPDDVTRYEMNGFELK